jgi:hypothetical protein
MQRPNTCYFDDDDHPHVNLQRNVDYYVLHEFNGKRKAISLCDVCADEHGHVCEFCDESFEPYCNIVMFNSSVYHADCLKRVKYFIDNNRSALTL